MLAQWMKNLGGGRAALETCMHNEHATHELQSFFVLPSPFITFTDLRAFLADTRWNNRAAFV